MTEKHHLWWPRRDYQTPTEKEFRNLPCNLIPLDDWVHRLIHVNSLPPRKPSHDDMAEAVRRHKVMVCPCKRRTNEG